MLENIILSLVIALSINFAMFLVAYRLQTDKLTDVTWASTFILIVLVELIRTIRLNTFSLILAVIVIVWAVRIGSFLLYRVLKKGKDKRFDERRSSFFGFLRFWLGQAIAAWVLLIPTTFAISKGGSFKLLSIIGVMIWAIGLLIETTADIQKYIFLTKSENKNKWIETGLWHLSRHPNYFGEILVWIGVYVFCLGSLSTGLSVIGLVSPLAIILLLVYVSGVPILEKNADKKWGKDANYEKYKKNTSLLIPIPKKM